METKAEFAWSDLKTIPNILSISRLALIPALIIPYLMTDTYQAKIVFLILFILIGVTDKLDGILARYLNQTSALGAKLDTMADILFYPLIGLWLSRFASQVLEGRWTLIYILLAMFLIKIILARIKFGYLPAFHTIGGKTFAASLYFFMILAVLYPDVAAKLFPVVCIIGYINQIEETYIFITRDHIDENIRSVFK